MATGKIVQVVGPVVDVEFPAKQLPKLYNALKVQGVTLEVMAHLGEDVVRAIALGPTEGLMRHLDVEDTGALSPLKLVTAHLAAWSTCSASQWTKRVPYNLIKRIPYTAIRPRSPRRTLRHVFLRPVLKR